MADLLRIRAGRDNGTVTWSWESPGMTKYNIVIDGIPTMTINDGDVWQVELVDRRAGKGRAKGKAIVRLITKVMELKGWEQIDELEGFWVDPLDLRSMLTWLHCRRDIILIGAKGSGKTTLPYKIAEALGWQEPCKVDVGMLKKTTDLFGANAAADGASFFSRSALLDYVMRAKTALRQGLEDHFIVILDELNRVHARANEGMHGLFDDTRQITITTTEGPKVIRLPSNIHFIGTMNQGASYVGTFAMDEALKDRFMPIQVKGMPFDFEVAMLAREAQIDEQQAHAIVSVAQRLRDAADAGQVSYAPSYRVCRAAADLCRHGVKGDATGSVVRTAIIKSMLGWYAGKMDEKGQPADASSELGKAWSALRLQGLSGPGAKAGIADRTFAPKR